MDLASLSAKYSQRINELTLVVRKPPDQGNRMTTAWNALVDDGSARGRWDSGLHRGRHSGGANVHVNSPTDSSAVLVEIPQLRYHLERLEMDLDSLDGRDSRSAE